MCARDPMEKIPHSQCKYEVSIPPSLIFCWDQLNEPCGVKNLYSQFVYANPAYIKLLGLPSGFDITGCYDYDLPFPSVDFSHDFQLHDRLVECEKQRRSSLEVHYCGIERKLDAYFFDKFPFYNDFGEVVGTYFHARHAHYIPLDFYFNRSARNTSLILYKPKSSFSKREWDVLFLLLQNFSQKEIADFLMKKVGYINNVVSRIYTKCRLNNVNQLRELARFNGWDGYIPERFISCKHIVLGF